MADVELRQRSTSDVIATDDLAPLLLDLVGEVAGELHPHGQRPGALTLSSSLERDLGFDSLGRVELLLRIERRLAARLPEDALALAETPRDLLQGVLAARERGGAAAARRGPATMPRPVLEEVEQAPERAGTLLEVLDWHVQAHADRPHVYLVGDEREEVLTYGQLQREALSVAAGLRQRDVAPGDTVAIMLPTSRAYYQSFFGCLLAGAVPVPIYPPARPSQIEDHLRRHARILQNAGVRALITVPEAVGVARLLRAQVDTLRDVVTADELLAEPEGACPQVKPSDIAFLQYTSGSTGNPKGVVLTHQNLLANLRVMGRSLQVGPRDTFVSWLPLYHDMGLIGAWLGSLCYAYPLVSMSPLTFLARPERWLQAIHEHRATLSAGPNFAYELAARRVRDEHIEAIGGLDLSTWRLAFNGAEPVSPDTIRRFTERFAPYGFRAEAMYPVYGLAENSLGLAFPPLGRKPLVDRVQRAALGRDGRAVPAADDDGDGGDGDDALRFVACGRPLPGHPVRIVDAAGHELGERREGRLQWHGPSATSGYYRNPEATAALFCGEWLDSGDLAYMADGDLYLTSRAKDLVIKAGRNIYPAELEQVVGELEGVRKGCVVVFGSADARSGTERLVVVAESRVDDPAQLAALRQRIEQATLDLLHVPADDVVVAPPHSVLKTSSGKVRRAASREMYAAGALGKGKQRAVWLQVLRLVAAGLVPRARRGGRAAVSALYAAYFWSVLVTGAVPTWFLVVLSPSQRWSRAVMRTSSRAILGAAGIPVRVLGLAHLAHVAQRPHVVVCNHASYLDSLALFAALPAGYAFVGKAELGRGVLTRPFVRRLGVQLVERFDRERGVQDARNLADVAAAGSSLVCFPEGGLIRMPGLRAFHLGAFDAAVRARCPVVPIGLRGTRALLRPEQWFPRRGPLAVTVAEPLEVELAADETEWAATVRLRDAARAACLERCGEPDVAGGNTVSGTFFAVGAAKLLRPRKKVPDTVFPPGILSAR